MGGVGVEPKEDLRTQGHCVYNLLSQRQFQSFARPWFIPSLEIWSPQTELFCTAGMQGWAGPCFHSSAAAPTDTSRTVPSLCLTPAARNSPCCWWCSVQGLHNSQEIITKTISVPLIRQGMFSQQTPVCWRWCLCGCSRGWLEFCSPRLRMNNLNPLKALGTLLPCPVPAEMWLPQAILISCPSVSMDVHLLPLAVSSHLQCAALGYAQLVSVS